MESAGCFMSSGHVKVVTHLWNQLGVLCPLVM